MTSNGIVSVQNGTKVHLDPKRATSDGLAFVSHAHMDHLHNQNGGLLLTTKQTSEIAKHRAYNIENYVEEYEELSMVDTVDILGRRVIAFSDLFYTRDTCIRYC